MNAFDLSSPPPDRPDPKDRVPVRLGFLLLAWFLPALMYVSLFSYWGTHGFYPPEGDEPVYLKLSHSLVQDGDYNLENNHEYAEGRLWHHPPDGGMYSSHYVGLPLLLAPSYAWAETAGAKLFLCLLHGLFGVFSYLFLKRILMSRGWALLTSLAMFMSLPFLPAANQVYPDLVAGLVTFVVLERLHACWCRGTIPISQTFLLSLLISFLPALHLKFAPATLVLTGGAVWLITTISKDGVKKSHLVILFGMILVSASLLLSYNIMAYGTPFGGRGSRLLSNPIRTSLMVMLGLHWDQAQGIFLQQPLFLLGLVGLPRLMLRRPRWGTFWVLVYGSLIVPHALHPGLYGGWSLYGRYGWSSVALWVVPASLEYGRMIRNEESARLGLLLGLGFGYQLILAPNWLADHWLIMADSLFYAPGFPVEWANVLLPRFHEVDVFLYHVPNLVVVGWSVVLIYYGFRSEWKHGREVIEPKPEPVHGN